MNEKFGRGSFSVYRFHSTDRNMIIVLDYKKPKL